MGQQPRGDSLWSRSVAYRDLRSESSALQWKDRTHRISLQDGKLPQSRWTYVRCISKLRSSSARAQWLNLPEYLLCSSLLTDVVWRSSLGRNQTLKQWMLHKRPSCLIMGSGLNWWLYILIGRKAMSQCWGSFQRADSAETVVAGKPRFSWRTGAVRTAKPAEPAAAGGAQRKVQWQRQDLCVVCLQHTFAFGLCLCRGFFFKRL